MLTAAQKKTRSTGLGSSEIAAIVGVSPFGDAAKVWLSKTGRLAERGNRATTAGQRLEAAVAKWAADEHGWSLRKCGRTLRGPEKWITASPDYWRCDGAGGAVVGLVEVKTASNPDWIDPVRWGSFGPDGSDEVPKAYRCQAQWQMLATDTSVCHLPVFFFMSRELRVYTVEHSDALAETLVGAGRRFWHEHVLTDEMPEIAETGDSTDAALAALLRDTTGKIVQAPGEAGRWAAELHQANRDIADAEERKERATNYLKAYVGEDKGIENYWGRFTWSDSAGRIDYKAAFEALAETLGLPHDKRAGLAEQHRAASARRVAFKWKEK